MRACRLQAPTQLAEQAVYFCTSLFQFVLMWCELPVCVISAPFIWQLFHTVLAEDTVDGDGTGCDNMTCIIIDLQKSTRPDPKNHRTSSTGFDHTLCEDLSGSPANTDEEPKVKKAKVD